MRRLGMSELQDLLRAARSDAGETETKLAAQVQAGNLKVVGIAHTGVHVSLTSIAEIMLYVKHWQVPAS